jgi:hypothetical protein
MRWLRRYAGGDKCQRVALQQVTAIDKNHAFGMGRELFAAFRAAAAPAEMGAGVIAIGSRA